MNLDLPELALYLAVKHLAYAAWCLGLCWLASAAASRGRLAAVLPGS